MKNIYLIILITVISNNTFASITGTGESGNSEKIMIQPGIGLHPAPFSDLIISNLMQWNLKKNFSIASHSSYIFNDFNMRDFNYIKTQYNFSLNQKFGAGISVYREKSSHTFLIMGGIKYDAFKQTLNNPEFEKVSMKVNALSPDCGILYNLKAGKKKYFFSFSVYLPVYPYPVKGFDINFIESNMNNFSLEMGFGIRLK